MDTLPHYNDIISSIFSFAFALLRSFALLLSPPIQWFIYIFLLRSPLEKMVFSQTLGTILFFVCTLAPTDGGDGVSDIDQNVLVHRIRNDEREKDLFYLFCCLFHTLFWTHKCTFLQWKRRHTVPDSSEKKLNKINKTRVFAYSSASVRSCALQRTSISLALRHSIRSRSRLLFASLHSILF